MKFYEIPAYNGNVTSVVTDIRIPLNDPLGTANVACYKADLRNYYDYYCGVGMLMPERNGTLSPYRYGAQGSLLDAGFEGDDRNHITTYYREGNLESMLWWSVDPKASATPWESPYTMMGGNAVLNVDPLGDKIKPKGSEEDKQAFLEKMNRGQDGVIYKYDKKGRLVIDNDKTKVETKDYDDFTKNVVSAIEKSKTIKLNLLRGDPKVKFDSWNKKAIDLTDLDQISENFQIAIIGHTIVERAGKGSIENRHTLAQKVETNILEERFSITGLHQPILLSKLPDKDNKNAVFCYSYGKGVFLIFKADIIFEKGIETSGGNIHNYK